MWREKGEVKKVGRRGSVILFFAAMFGLAILPLCAQTSLAMSNPEVLARLVNNKTEIERCIILATPGSLAQTREGLIQSKVISEDDKNAMLEIIRGISALLYPPPRTNGKDTASGFFMEPSLRNINPIYSVCLTQLVEASHGRIFSAPKGSEGAFLAEILPALAIFRSSDREVARTALGYVERFEAAGSFPSAVTGLVRARFARLAGDPVASYSHYKQVLDSYPDVWPARLELGILSLELEKPVNALAFLSPLMESRGNDTRAVTPYTVALYRNGKLAEAEPFARKGLAYEPESGELLQIAAHILIDKNDFAAAQPYLDAFGKKRPGDKMFLYLKAILTKGQNRHEEALKWARKALQLYPEDPEVMVLLAGILFKGSDAGRDEATALSLEARKRFAADRALATGSGIIPLSPLRNAMREEADGEAARFLMLDAYNHQNWYAAAAMLEESSETGLDKEVVATILRKSGRNKEALAFSSEWYRNTPLSEAAVEAYLRSLAAASTGIGVASAAGPVVSDAGAGFLGLFGGFSQGTPTTGLELGQPSIVGLVLQLLSGSCSANMRSYLLYLRGTLQSDTDAAIDSFRMALIERADNVEAIVALARAYARKSDTQKALFFVRQAKTIGISDAALAAELQSLEAMLSQG